MNDLEPTSRKKSKKDKKKNKKAAHEEDVGVDEMSE